MLGINAFINGIRSYFQPRAPQTGNSQKITEMCTTLIEKLQIARQSGVSVDASDKRQMQRLADRLTQLKTPGVVLSNEQKALYVTIAKELNYLDKQGLLKGFLATNTTVRKICAVVDKALGTGQNANHVYTDKELEVITRAEAQKMGIAYLE